MKMSFKAVAATLTRTLWTKGHKTPPLARSPKVNRLSTTCRVSAAGAGIEQGCKEKTKIGSSDRPSGEVPSFTEPAHRCTTGDKKRPTGPKEPVGAPGVATGVKRRSHTSTAVPANSTSYLWARYNETKRLVHGKQRITSLFPKSPPK